MNIENFSKMRGLLNAHQTANSHFLDRMLDSEQGEEVREKFALKRLQFDTSQALYSEVESICSLLDCSKREFLEMAVIDGIRRSMAAFEESFKEGSGQEFMEVYGVKES